MMVVVADAVFGRGTACVSCLSKLWHNRLLWTRTTQSRPRYFLHSLNARQKRISLAIGEPAPGAYFADIEARISSMYKAVAKRRLRIGAEVAELLDFGELWRSLDHGAIAHYVDCDTAVYDFALPPHRPGGRQPQESSPSGNFVPDPVFTLGQAGPFRQPARVFRCARAVAGHRDSGRHRNSDLRRRAPPKNCEDRGPRRPDAPDHRRDRGNLPQPGAAPAGPEQALRRLRLPAKVSRPRHRTRRFEPAHAR